MKIDISKIDEGRFVIREELNPEHVKQLAQSLIEDGQWNPVIVRPKEGGRYELVAGHYRLQATKEAGLQEIEATVRDLSDEETILLSLKTNLLRLDMTAREQGKVLSQMIEEFGWSQSKLAEKLGVSHTWIGMQLKVALDLHEKVAKALDEGKINYAVASVIGSLKNIFQPDLLKIILDKGITQPADASKIKSQFLNDTIFTVGYQDRSISDFIEVLKNNEIKRVIDARYSAESQFKPEFSGNILKNELKRAKIDYDHKPELGIPYIIQNPYKRGEFSFECLRQWYRAHLKEHFDMEEFVTHLKNSGKSVLMCMERYAKPMRNQQYACHRDILADLILEHESEDPLLRFEKRIDL